MNTAPSDKERIAVIGATGHQGSAVVHALQAGGQFFVRVLTRHPDTYRELGDEVVGADLNRPDTLQPTFTGTNGIFLVTNLWEQGTDEFAQGTAAVRAAKACRRQTLPLVEGIGLERIGVECDRRKGITTDERQRATVPHVYAVGDCACYWRLAHRPAKAHSR
jgi:putative NADH-flavin reductase